MWVLDGLRSPEFEDPVFAFEAYLGHLRETGSCLLLLIDELSGMPLETVRWLGHLIANSKGELRLIATALENPLAYERIMPLGPACETIVLDSPMQPEESAEYLHRRLQRANAPEGIRDRFDPATVAELHRISGGNPRELNTAAVRLLAEHRAARVQTP
jgi:hypothetical protein